MKPARMVKTHRNSLKIFEINIIKFYARITLHCTRKSKFNPTIAITITRDILGISLKLTY